MSQHPSDQHLTQMIHQRLADSTDFKNQAVAVEVRDGHVLLTGDVDSAATASAIVDLIDTIDGVASVTDQLRRQTGAAPAADDGSGYRGRGTVSDPKATADDNLIHAYDDFK